MNRTTIKNLAKVMGWTYEQAEAERKFAMLGYKTATVHSTVLGQSVNIAAEGDTLAELALLVDVQQAGEKE